MCHLLLFYPVPNSRHLGVHTSVATSGTDENVPTQESPDSGVGGMSDNSHDTNSSNNNDTNSVTIMYNK